MPVFRCLPRWTRSADRSESPFVDMSVLDGVRVRHELIDDFEPRLLVLRKHFFPSAAEIQLDPARDSSHNGLSNIRLFTE